jgi:Uncharacterised nucleotidyltransferase
MSTTPADLQPSPEAAAFYRHAMAVLEQQGIPFLVGGAYAFAHYTGIVRHTKDFDLFVQGSDSASARRALEQAGYAVELSFPHWLAKAFCGEHFVDLIHGSGNGLTPVDAGWFDHAQAAEVLGTAVAVCPPEEMIWSKAFIMERERYDGADVAHLLHARGQDLDWPRLLARFGEHWRVLLAHLALFGYIYPAATSRIPSTVTESLLARLAGEMDQTVAEFPGALCRGTNLSREQYLHDLQRHGYQDARLSPCGALSAADIALWTAAIGQEELPSHAVKDAASAADRADR